MQPVCVVSAGAVILRSRSLRKIHAEEDKSNHHETLKSVRKPNSEENTPSYKARKKLQSYKPFAKTRYNYFSSKAKIGIGVLGLSELDRGRIQKIRRKAWNRKRLRRIINWCNSDEDWKTFFSKLPRRCQILLQSDAFNNLITVSIILAGILVGIQLYPNMEHNTISTSLDIVIVVVFFAEFIVKICSEGKAFWRYFCGPEWQKNVFDFFILIATLPMNPLDKAIGKGKVGVLRLFRLMRLVKVFHKIPQLQIIVMGLMGGIKSVFSIITVVLIVFYIYAVVGIMAFRKNDPFHWSSLSIALITLFRAASLDDWTEILYINVYGCDDYKFGAGMIYCVIATEDCSHSDPLYHCINPSTSYFFAPVYFVSFIILSGFILLNMFIGAICMAMAESMNIMNEMKYEKEKEEKRLKNRSIVDLFRRTSVSKIRMRNSYVTGKNERQRAKLKHIIICAWEGKDISSTEIKFQVEMSGWKELYYRLARIMEKYTESSYFTNFFIGVILIVGILAGISTYTQFSSKHRVVLMIIDHVTAALFVIEISCKIIACEFEPINYFRNGGNVFDTIVVLGGYLPGAGSLFTSLKMLRLLRILKLVNKLPQLQIIVSALMIGLKSIGYIGAILVMFYYVYAIVGVSLFSENDPWHFGSLHMAMMSLFRCSTQEDWSDILYINLYGCNRYGYTEAMNASPWKCNEEKSGPVNFSTFYFLTFVVLGAMVLLTLFVGVVITSMEEVTLEMDRKANLQKEVSVLMEDSGLTQEAVDIYRSIFDLVDLDGGGEIEIEELKFVLGAVGRRPRNAELNEILCEIDGTGESIDFTCFLALMIYLQKRNENNIHGKIRKQNKSATFRITAINNKSMNNPSIKLTREEGSLFVIASKNGNRPSHSTVSPVNATGSSGVNNLISDGENYLRDKNHERTTPITSTITKSRTNINEQIRQQTKATFYRTAINNTSMNSTSNKLRPEKISLLLSSSNIGNRPPRPIFASDDNATGSNGVNNLISNEENCLRDKKDEKTTSVTSPITKSHIINEQKQSISVNDSDDLE